MNINVEHAVELPEELDRVLCPKCGVATFKLYSDKKEPMFNSLYITCSKCNATSRFVKQDE